MSRRHELSLSEMGEYKISYGIFRSSGASNTQAIEKMRKLAHSVMDTELTALQRYCVTEYVMNGTKQKDIAWELGLSRSTVSRHITAGMKKLRNAAKYHLSITG